MKTELTRRLLGTLVCLAIISLAEARHIAGGEMTYTYLGAGTQANTARYRITLRLYRDCQSTGAQLDATAAITFYNAGNGSFVENRGVGLNRIERVELRSPGPCIDNAPNVCYQIGYYISDIDLPINGPGYTVSYQRCCRIDNITNVVGSTNTGATYTATIPGTSTLANAYQNSTPVFNTSDTVIICEGTSFLYNFSATDTDGDQLSYAFEEAFDGGSVNQPQPSQALPPPYSGLTYSFGFSAQNPLGSAVSINRNTGIIGGRAPNAGVYVITVVVNETRNGVLINRQRKDLHIKVAACTIASADLQPEYVTCDGFNLAFQNRTFSPLIKTYYWDFGIPGRNDDTSTLEKPNFTFPDTGVYKVTLVTNRNQECSDTAFTLAKVFPGFFPDFRADPGCKEVPVLFKDLTTTRYGRVDSWTWTFGYPQVNPDTSQRQNPSYAYPTTGSYEVQLIVTSSKGCRDTVERTVAVLDRPGLQVTNDTLICSIDTLQLNAFGNGTFEWSPNIAINNTTVSNPLVSPDVPTMYYVKLSSAPGCENTDSVFVDVKQFVTVEARPDTTICLTDEVRLETVSDALSYRWEPAASLDDPTSKNPIARPGGTTTYSVTANIGKCQSRDAVTVRTAPYPPVQASDDTTVCSGIAVQLFASGGLEYRWAPASTLSDNRIPNPIARPSVTTSYVVSVRDDKGCPKPALDTVTVFVIPPVLAFAGNDTAVVIGQPLQLNASGGELYRWTPVAGLSDPNIPNPVANLNDDIVYAVRVSTEQGCFANDTIRVRVFKTDPDVFVPTAFTPNGDNLNDILTPIPVGVTNMEYFRVYNRWGELVFSTNQIGRGWDGSFKGREQGNDTFAWVVRATDFTGKVIAKKGTTTLIRK